MWKQGRETAVIFELVPLRIVHSSFEELQRRVRTRPNTYPIVPSPSPPMLAPAEWRNNSAYGAASEHVDTP